MKNILNTAPKKELLSHEKLELDNENLRLEIEFLHGKIAEMQAKLASYEEQLRLAKAKKFGSSSEKYMDNQPTLFNEAEVECTTQNPEPEPELEEIKYTRTKPGGKRKPTAVKYDDLERKDLYYDVAEEEQVCPCCGKKMKVISEKTRDEVVYMPAHLELHCHHQPVYGCGNKDCEGQNGGTVIVMGRAPEPPIPHSPAGPSMLAGIMSRKFSEHLPLYRQEQQFAYQGLSVSRQNMANWVIKGADWLEIVYNRLHALMFEEVYLHADETVIQVLSEPGKKATSNSYMWLYSTGRFKRLIYLYEYQSSRSGEHPKKFLSGFNGYLQCDGFAGYNAVKNVTIVMCFSHARRQFTDALKALPEDADHSRTLCAQGIKFIDQLFLLERGYAGMSSDERYEARLLQSKPVLNEYHAWLLEKKKLALPQGKLAGAVNYSVKHWDKLCGFLANGEIELSNNDCENGIRPFAIGRGNWLFAKSQNGAKASAIIYSIIETAKANALSPFHYLKHLFEKLPNINISDTTALDALLPWSDSLPQEVRPLAKPERDQQNPSNP